MAGRKVSHSEEWWASGAKPGVRRCLAMRPSGSQCKREAIQGSVVCQTHGGLAPQVQKRAKERITIVADAITQQMYSWFHDETIPIAARLKIGQDFLDRAGIDKSATLHIGADPIEQLFKNLLGDPEGLESNVIDAEIVEDDQAELEAAAYIDAIDEEADWVEPTVSVIEQERVYAAATNADLPRAFADDFKAGRFEP